MKLQGTEGPKTIRFAIEGMRCPDCATTIEALFHENPEVTPVKVDFARGMGEFTTSGNPVAANNIISTINRSGEYCVRNELSSKDTQYGFIIIGGGSAAFSAAIKANDAGVKTLIVNGTLPTGGTCVNVGCVPSKFLIRAAESVFHSSHSPFSGVEPAPAQVTMPDIIQQKKDLVGTLRQKKYLDVLKELPHVELLTAMAQFTNNHTIVLDDGRTFTATRILVATGATTAVPPVEGLGDVPWLTNVSLFELEELPESLIVLGGGYIALEIAQTWQRLGSKVTVIQRSGHILSKQSPDVGDELAEHLRQEGISILTRTRLRKIHGTGKSIVVEGDHDGEPFEVTGSHLLVATGTKPNTSGMGLDKAGVQLSPAGHIRTDNHMATNVHSIFAAGDCTATPAYVYTAAYEGSIAAQNALVGAELETDYTGLPWVVFTDPQVAGVGMDETEAREMNIPFETSTVPLSQVPRCIAALDTRGFVKLIRNAETDQLIGARIVAHEGSELTMALSLAIKNGIPVKELAATLFPYLTLSEAIKLAAIGFGKDVMKLSCCAA